jgi:hypothetical protein
MNTELAKLLNSRAEDLDFELGVYLNLDQVKGKYTTVADETAEEMKISLMNKLGVTLEEIAEEEELEIDEVENKHIQDALKYARQESDTEFKTYMTLERYINQLKNVGATEEEVKGLNDFYQRLESTIFDRFEITEDDLPKLEVINGEE